MAEDELLFEVLSDSDDDEVVEQPKIATTFTPTIAEPEWFRSNICSSYITIEDTALMNANLAFARRRYEDVVGLCRQAESFKLGKNSRKQWLDLEVETWLIMQQAEKAIGVAEARALLDRGHDTIGRKLHADVRLASYQYEGAKLGYMLCVDASPINSHLWHQLSKCYVKLHEAEQTPKCTCYAMSSIIRARAWAELSLQSAKGFIQDGLRHRLNGIKEDAARLGLSADLSVFEQMDQVEQTLQALGIQVTPLTDDADTNINAEHLPPPGLYHLDPTEFEQRWFHARQYLPRSEVELPEPEMPEKVDRGALATSSNAAES
eukprot:TRINITY_DN8706_c0_g2_i1.p2 TRINITY_DN8706_c0_g2~~TRINITY_DN8706_c0_g2_i1.p2  ORF type:complete len:320 (+),score=45.61 TRINITY_DN8706_c0_g2_i1:55-1014(+)